MTDDDGRRRDRRNLLKGFVAGTLSAAALAASGRALAIPESKEVREKTRYRLTEHIERFYQTNRY